MAAHAPDIIDYAVKNVSHKGILGVDVAQDLEGKLYILEANYSPMWKAFEQATGVNVAKEIINFAVKRLEQKKYN